MNPKYRPKTTEQKLGYLVEECGEVLAAVGKAQRWGLDSTNPELPPPDRETNRDWIMREVKDLERAIYFVREALVGQAAPPAARTIEVWAEGYVATGEHSHAHMLGRVVASDFNGAVLRIMAQMADQRSRECFSLHADGAWTFWGCRLFDNEADARVSFG